MHDVVFVEMLYISSANCKHNPVIDLDSINKKNTKNYQTCHLSGIINFNHVWAG